MPSPPHSHPTPCLLLSRSHRSQELKAADIPVQMLHPGFNRTAMTKKYEHIWDIEGAVEPEVGAKRVLYESLKADMSTTGTVINCEDGLRIPW